MIMRQAATDVELSGGTVPAGATVTCLIGAANRDESRYRDPGTFDIFRTDLTTTTAFSAAADHLAFALGRHFCVGALLAKAEVETGVGHLLDAMPGLRVADGFGPVEHGVFTRGPKALPLRFTPVSPDGPRHRPLPPHRRRMRWSTEPPAPNAPPHDGNPAGTASSTSPQCERSASSGNWLGELDISSCGR